MLDILRQVEAQLPALLRDETRWKTVLVDYHPPVVERLWCDLGDFRVYLHQIHPCEPGEALFHPHPWPSAMRVLAGTYEMGIGYGPGMEAPPVAARLIMGPGTEYEMTDRDGWHDVRPVGGATMSLMVTGKPWSRPSPKSEKPLHPLQEEREQQMLGFFRDRYR